MTRLLEHQSPGQYREAELATVSELLGQVNGGQLKATDVSSLFETAQAVGDSSLVPALTNAAADSKYMATLALAGLRDGAGVPALIELARDGSPAHRLPPSRERAPAPRWPHRMRMLLVLEYNALEGRG